MRNEPPEEVPAAQLVEPCLPVIGRAAEVVEDLEHFTPQRPSSLRDTVAP
jgi:hypothetical protein